MSKSVTKTQIDLSPLVDAVEAVAASEGKLEMEVAYFEAKKKQSFDVGFGWKVIGVNGGGKKKKVKRAFLLRVGPSDVMPMDPSRRDWDALAHVELESPQVR